MKLPTDCTVEYHAGFLTPPESADLFGTLTSGYDLFHKGVTMADGTVLELERRRFMFADPELTGFESLPEVWGPRAPWPPPLAEVRGRIERTAGRAYQVCRCLYYESGQVGVAFHADFPAYGSMASVASLSLGASRRFLLRRKEDPDELHSLVLEDGSLLIMGEHCQDRYEHALPVDETCRAPRINLTFRQFGWD